MVRWHVPAVAVPPSRLGLVAVVLLAAAVPAGNRPSHAGADVPVTIGTAYTTGYTWFDNTPPGSAVISHPVVHRHAGGTGTYADPVTVAVGHSTVGGRDTLDHPPGSRFYVPHLRRYFVVEDTCGDGPVPQHTACHDLGGAPPGATTWLDLYVGGGPGDDPEAVRACAEKITDGDGHRLHTVVENPPATLPVAAGPLFAAGRCSDLY